MNTFLPPEQVTRACAPRMPGIAPLDFADWLQISEVYGPQMALRRELLAQRSTDVLVEASPVLGSELLDFVLAQLAARPDFEVTAEAVICADGVQVAVDRAAPLATLAQIVQEDFCILVPQDGEYVLRAAVLCFPASWTLREKMGRPLLGIHAPVDTYMPDLAKRVQRLLEAIRPEAPLWRANALFYDAAELFHPRTEAAPREIHGEHEPYLRSERQSLLRLPSSGAVVFSIHTYLLRRAALTPAQSEAFEQRKRAPEDAL
ncbi:heme-dependent oxidative N-demethylase family protein [Falsihalocynthiibacter arcticus]|uniref:heme-dependent oxidative N-demethylase family protein n=1 Tax=Falsihalocynthiibacter arcticus TaxID=1579316 RepID=UPI001F3906F7|nr:DUF3445 domain-containing protein [Falsihalocynthiibacter arcticus]